MKQITTPLALLIIAVATIYPLLIAPVSHSMWFAYAYAAGAALMLIGQLFTKNTAKDARLRRLNRIEGWSAIFFCVGAFFLFWPGSTMRDWLAFTLAGAAIQIFTSIMIPRRQHRLKS